MPVPDRRRLRASAAAIAVALLAGLSAPARAHLGHVVVRAERYLKIDAHDSGVRLVVSLTLGPGESQRVLQAADADGDGTVTQAEADAYMAEWGDGLREDLPVRVDGRVVPVAWAEPYMDPIGPIRPLPGTVEMVAPIDLEEGTHTITFVDRMRREAFDRTDVAFRSREGARIEASGLGEAPTDAITALAFAATDDHDTFTAVVYVPGDPDALRDEAPWVPIAAGAVLLLAVGVTVARRRRRG